MAHELGVTLHAELLGAAAIAMAKEIVVNSPVAVASTKHLMIRELCGCGFIECC